MVSPGIRGAWAFTDTQAKMNRKAIIFFMK
jgi:hypothetical protein